MFNPMDFFPNFVSAQTGYPRSLNTEIVPNAGNFQEYTYELEWMECVWNNTYQITDMVTAYWYPWLRKDS
jgi:hypothetical protein